MSKKLLNVDSESLEFKDPIYKKSGNNIVVEFDKCFNNKSSNLNLFMISKNAYSKRSDEICRYSNVFFQQYDEEKEFLTALLSIKYQIDSKTMYYPLSSFISDIATYLLSDSIVEKINRMVDDYYDIDLSPSEEIKNIDLHALQFMNEHGRAIMAVSVACKLTIPVVCHYYSIKSDDMADLAKLRGEQHMSNKDYLYRVFTSYLPLFQGESDIFTKLAVTANSHLTSTIASEKIMWNRAKNKNITPTIQLTSLISSIIVDLIPKAIFKKNIIFLIQVALPEQIKNVLIAKDKYEYYDIGTTGKGEELSGLDKLEVNSARISDLDIIIGNVNRPRGIKEIQEKFNIDISDKELKFYKKNLRSFAFSELILQFFSKYFGGYYDLQSISKKDYIRLVILFKKIMYDIGFRCIQHLICGNVSSKIKRRRISSKQLKKIESSYHFQKLMEEYSSSMDMENNSIMKNIGMLINTPVEYVDYDNQERLGQDIKVDVELIADEYIQFVKMI